MLHTRICTQCEQLLNDVSNAMRRHAACMTGAITWARVYEVHAEEQRQEFSTELVASFDEAQSTWDSYREHLIEHGILSRRDRT